MTKAKRKVNQTNQRKTNDRQEIRFSIIAGELKGKSVTVPNPGVTRPPLGRLRRAIFDFLWPYLENARYLDLFSGSGSYLFEAVSRGAGEVTGVEQESLLVEAINRRAKELGVSDRLVCLCQDVFKAIPALVRKKKVFDLLMIAPPQYESLIDETLQVLRESPILTPDSMIICQHDSSETNGIDFGNWKINQRRKYGNTTFTILSHS
jgi:16S rRNA (guanine(966)-N(2))-methyltransferase RsmD